MSYVIQERVYLTQFFSLRIWMDFVEMVYQNLQWEFGLMFKQRTIELYLLLKIMP